MCLTGSLDMLRKSQNVLARNFDPIGSKRAVNIIRAPWVKKLKQKLNQHKQRYIILIIVMK